MSLTVHLFGHRSERGVIVAHCGRAGFGLTTSTILAAVTCRDCRRREPPRAKFRPKPPTPSEDPVKGKARRRKRVVKT